MGNARIKKLGINKTNAELFLTKSLLNAYKNMLEVNKFIVVPFSIYKLMEVSGKMKRARDRNEIRCANKIVPRTNQFTI